MAVMNGAEPALGLREVCIEGRSKSCEILGLVPSGPGDLCLTFKVREWGEGLLLQPLEGFEGVLKIGRFDRLARELHGIVVQAEVVPDLSGGGKIKRRTLVHALELFSNVIEGQQTDQADDEDNGAHRGESVRELLEGLEVLEPPPQCP